MQDHVVIITGASRGVGAACAVACAREGARVVLAAKTVEPDPRLPGTLYETKQLVEDEQSEAMVVPFDARDPEQCEDVVRKAASWYGRVDAVINNAGAIFWAPVADWPQKKFDLVMAVNVRASFALAKAAIPHLRKQGGHVLMMSPPINPLACVGKAPYHLSKIGMTLLAMAIDAEEKANGITASALWPVTAIKTAATVNLGMGDDAEWRTPEILADATVAILTQDPRTASYRAWLDEEALRELAGRSDFTGYRCLPGHEPSPMSIELVDPGWGARNAR